MDVLAQSADSTIFINLVYFYYNYMETVSLKLYCLYTCVESGS